jgi:cytosine/adenosine deaminase-related metal-dependent hydrolase
LEHEIGSIKPGKKADLTVLSDDPLGVDPLKIRDIRVIATMFAGRRVVAGAQPAAPGATTDLQRSQHSLSNDAPNSPAG